MLLSSQRPKPRRVRLPRDGKPFWRRFTGLVSHLLALGRCALRVTTVRLVWERTPLHQALCWCAVHEVQTLHPHLVVRSFASLMLYSLKRSMRLLEDLVRSARRLHLWICRRRSSALVWQYFPSIPPCLKLMARP